MQRQRTSDTVEKEKEFEQFFQHQNPVTKRWYKFSKHTGRLVARGPEDGTPFQGVPVLTVTEEKE